MSKRAWFRAISCLGGLLLIAPLSGCGNGLGSVYGSVTLGGEEVTKTDSRRCSITFTPLGGGAKASGNVDEGGNFNLSTGSRKGVAPGDYAVSVLVREVTPPSTPGGYSQSKRLSPKRYSSPGTSGLTYTVDGGSNRFDITLDPGD